MPIFLYLIATKQPFYVWVLFHMFQVDPLPTQWTLRNWNVSETRSTLAQQPMACQKAIRQPSTATTKKPHHGSHVPKNDRHGSSESIHHRSRRPPGQRDRNKVFSSPPSNKPRKVRRVPNASSIFKGASLNCNLLTRPNLLTNLTGNIMKFREDQIEFPAYIEAMFMQVFVKPQDQPYLRILWKDDHHKPVTYYYTRHIFGASK